MLIFPFISILGYCIICEYNLPISYYLEGICTDYCVVVEDNIYLESYVLASRAKTEMGLKPPNGKMPMVVTVPYGQSGKVCTYIVIEQLPNFTKFEFHSASDLVTHIYMFVLMYKKTYVCNLFGQEFEEIMRLLPGQDTMYKISQTTSLFLHKLFKYNTSPQRYSRLLGWDINLWSW